MDLAEVAVLEGCCVLVFIATKGRRETRNWKGRGGGYFVCHSIKASGALLRLIVADEIDYLTDRDRSYRLSYYFVKRGERQAIQFLTIVLDKKRAFQ